MQLSHLLPHVDAEISRLQRARDLLTLHLEFLQTHPATDAKHLARVVPDQVGEDSAAETAVASTAVGKPASAPGLPQVVITRVKERRTYTRNDEARQDKKRRAMAVDTALSGSVPSGPVVVSAEEARRSQASKVAQFTRAAEVKRAGAELVAGSAWRSPGSDAQHVDALLQRLMSIGEHGREGGSSVGQLASQGQSQSLENLGAPLALKAD